MRVFTILKNENIACVICNIYDEIYSTTSYLYEHNKFIDRINFILCYCRKLNLRLKFFAKYSTIFIKRNLLINFSQNIATYIGVSKM